MHDSTRPAASMQAADSHGVDTVAPLRDPAGGPDGTVQATARLKTAFAAWRGRLIDLTKRNRALNYRPTKVSTLTVVDEKPAEIYRLLVGEEQALTFTAAISSKTADDELSEESQPLTAISAQDAAAQAVTAPTSDEDEDATAGPLALQPFAPYARTDLADRHRDTELQCHTTPEGLDVTLRRLAELQRTSLEEQGVNTLYLALGFLHYKEAPQAETALRAPLVLVPVMLERASARSGYRLILGDDEPVINPSLVEYLRRVHQLTSVPTIPEPGDDPSSLDLLPFFAAMSAEVATARGWKVTEEIALATFAFQKLVIYKDLQAHEELFQKHQLVRRVVLKEVEPAHDLPPEVRALDLDQDYPPEATFQVLDADSSQLRAIAAVSRGHDLVIHGPPGTGKSQTITNLVADALGSGKRVLFVSEKMAALEVVHRRLSETKLGEFCFELHSTKARKGEVIEDLKRTLDASGAPATGTTQSKDALAKTRSHLNAYARELHTVRTALQCTAYRALGEFASTFTAPRVAFPADPTALTVKESLELTEKLSRAETLGRDVAPVAENGWRDAHLTTFSEDLAEQIGAALEEARLHARTFVAQAAGFGGTFGLPTPATLESAATLSAPADYLASGPGVPAFVLRDRRWASPLPDVMELLALGRQCTALEQRLRSRYRHEDLDGVDRDEVRYAETKLSGTFGFLALLDGRYRAIRRRWQAMRLPGTMVSMLDQAADLKQAPKWQRDRQALANHGEAGAWFGAAWRGPASDWADLEARVAWVQQFHHLAEQYSPLGEVAYQLAEQGGAGHPLPQALRTTAAGLRDALSRLQVMLQWPEGHLISEPVLAVAGRLDELHRDRQRGPAWVTFVRAINALADTPAAPMTEAAFVGRIPVQELGRAFRRALYSTWLDRVVPTVTVLADFSTAVHEDARRAFQQLDARLLVENQATLVTKLREMAQSRYASSKSVHRAFLQKEFAKQRRHRPLRVTFREAAEAVAALKPCFLMSPMSVSQFLTPELAFDLVIFDEASQLPTEDAIAAICRGQRLVVVGDPKQLPPTNFFAVQVGASNTTVDEDGEPVLEETESVLEEFQGVGLHQAYLEWHYRSAHESLIQFSNERFYGNRLVVFPAAAAEGPECGLKFEYLPDGRYEGAGLNLVEARRVAAAVIEHFRTRSQETLGVGTFNLRQQLAILDELERYRREDPTLEPYFDRALHEPFFVKNLENIQGDERDVIFLSITYGKQADGRLRYNFGPLNREQGWRRLNVLVSRARRRMRVFSSLRAADINPTAVATQGAALLSDFLRFAETGKLQVTSTATASEAESPFELEVGEVLQGMGYLIDRQLGVGPYRIDFGVRHGERPGRYLAGVECDGAAYHSAPCARDRDRLRQQVLERRGWTILRVWSTDWFRDRTGTLDRLRRTLAALHTQLKEEDRQRDQAAPPAPEPPVIAKIPSTAPSNGPARPYVRPQLPTYVMASRLEAVSGSLADAGVGQVARHIAHIVDQEAPVHVDDVIERLLYVWDHARRGSRLVAAAEAGIRFAGSQQLVVRRGDFLYSDRPIQPRNRAGLAAGAEQVAPEELMATARVALGAADCLDEANLLVEVREMLGLRRTQDGMSCIQSAIEALVGEGTVVHGAAGLRLRLASLDSA
jgi:very-short-patch-repair endonuclease